MNNIAKAYSGVSVFAGVGKEPVKRNDLLREMIEAGIMNYGDEFKQYGRRRLGPEQSGYGRPERFPKGTFVFPDR